MFEFKGVQYDTSWESKDTRHGGPFDRGSADSYYGRPTNPHFYIGATGTSDFVGILDMSEKDIQAYYAGYAYNEEKGDKKEW